jgi:hypothetical protein
MTGTGLRIDILGLRAHSSPARCDGPLSVPLMAGIGDCGFPEVGRPERIGSRRSVRWQNQ